MAYKSGMTRLAIIIIVVCTLAGVAFYVLRSSESRTHAGTTEPAKVVRIPRSR